jgi:hypothetical protein
MCGPTMSSCCEEGGTTADVDGQDWLSSRMNFGRIRLRRTVARTRQPRAEVGIDDGEPCGQRYGEDSDGGY